MPDNQHNEVSVSLDKDNNLEVTIISSATDAQKATDTKKLISEYSNVSCSGVDDLKRRFEGILQDSESTDWADPGLKYAKVTAPNADGNASSFTKFFLKKVPQTGNAAKRRDFWGEED
jgi:hypothetical protein